MNKVTIGGQALIEGIMMKTDRKKSIAIRTKDGEIIVKNKNIEDSKYKKIPFIRGIYQLFSSLFQGIEDLNYSQSFFDEKDGENSDMTVYLSLIASFAIAIFGFSFLPSFIASLLKIENNYIFSMIEGVIKITIFIIYMYFISRIEDIKRVFMYHGAEHKTVFAYERGLNLTVDNIKKMPRLHPRCGTNFICIVLIISIIFNFFIITNNILIRVFIKILILPLVSAISYEIIKLAGKSHNIIFKIISFPGLMMQKITTKEPDDSMIEVAIKATNNALNMEDGFYYTKA